VVVVRCVFHGTAAFLGRIDGDTRCAFWADEPVDHEFDPGQLIEVDLARTPAAAAAGEIGWDEGQVDDCFAGPNGAASGTTLGPRWPELRLAGAVYLERGFAASLPAALRPPCPPAGVDGEAHEFTTAAYWPGTGDPRAGNRYAGHSAEIRQEQGTLARVAVWPPGRAHDPAADPVTMWIDLASPEQCDAGPDSLTTIATGAGRKRGALFLISGQVAGPAPTARPASATTQGAS
jgi:hypothetical protein